FSSKDGLGRESSKIEVGLAVLCVFLAEPREKLPVVLLAAITSIGGGVVAQIEQATPAAGGVGRRTVRSKASKDGQVARLKLQGHCRALIDCLGRERMVVPVLGGEAALAVVTGVDHGTAVVQVARVDGNGSGNEGARETRPGDVVLVQIV